MNGTSGLLRFLISAGMMSFNNGLDSSSRVELASDSCPLGPTGSDHIFKNSVDGILIEDSQVPVSQDVVFQGFKLQA